LLAEVVMSDLSRLMAAQAGEIANYVRLGLESESTPHYQRLSDALLRRRCLQLVDAFVESTDGDPARFLSYVGSIVNERMAEGLGLGEVQHALTLLESRAWASVIECSDVDRVVRHLGVVTRLIGMAKDELARRYVAGRPPARGAPVEVDALFAGTDGPLQEGGTPER
jgi:hypothetical protein